MGPTVYIDGEDRPPTTLIAPQSALDGCVLLGRDGTGTTCEYATRYHLTDREAQRREVANRVRLGQLVPCLAPKTCALRTRTWGVFRSEITLVSLHILVLVLGYLKAFVHTMETEYGLNLMHAVMEAFIVCQILIVRAIIVKDKFHELKRCRLELEYVSQKGAGRSRSVKIWTFAYFICSLILCVLVIVFLLLCLKYAHLGWTSLPNNVLLVTAVFVAKISVLRYEMSIAQIQKDHMLMVLLEAKSLLGEQLCVLSTSHTKEVDGRVEHFLKGINKTPAFDKPYYISYQDKIPPAITTHKETDV